MASGLANVTMPSGERITGSYERLGHKATTLMNDIGNWEYGHLSADFTTMEDMLAGITQIVNGQSGKASVTITGYQAGSIAKVPAFQKLQEASAKQSANLEGSTKDLEDAINGYSLKQQERDLSDQRTKEGKMQILEGTLIAAAAVLSAVAIVATFGAATPVVVSAFAVASASGLYGMSNANEGLNNITLGKAGDSTTAAINPIRDTLFVSNPNLYYTVGNANTMVCTLAVPVGGAATSAMKAGTSVAKAITIEGGKIALSTVAGSATTDAVYKKTNNQLFATIAGMGVGSLAYGGMTKYDTAKNLSGYHTKATVENVGKNANVLKEQGASDTVTYRRVQGGTPPNASQKRIIVNDDGTISISNKNANLNISTGDDSHAQYFLNKRGKDAEIVEFEVPIWLDDFLNENAIPQKGYKTNPLNQGSSAPKIVDPTTPGISYEVPTPWIEWLQEYSINAKIIR